MKNGIISGIILIIIGIGLFAYYDQEIKPEMEAKKLVSEGELLLERFGRFQKNSVILERTHKVDNNSLNRAIDLFTKVIAKYPDTDSATKSYWLIAKSYEQLGLHRQAYLKYIYVLKNNKELTEKEKIEIKTSLAKIKVLRSESEEGIYNLMGLLNVSDDDDFRSRIYAELGHTYLKRNEVRKALKMFDIALRTKSRNEEAILGRARSFKRLGKDEKAYDIYDNFLKYYGAFSQYTKDVRSSYLKQVYDSGRRSYKSGSYYRAIGFHKRLINRFHGSKYIENSLYWIGESYFAMKKYDSGIKYFNRALTNGFYHKDEDSRMKKGYSYFLMKRYDLAAKEFQLYLSYYPKGKHKDVAIKWKNMSTKELMYQVEGATSKNSEDNLSNDEEGEVENIVEDNVEEKEKHEKKSSKNDGTSGSYTSEVSGSFSKLDLNENIAEL